jgi:signal transduction histidine kinase
MIGTAVPQTAGFGGCDDGAMSRHGPARAAPTLLAAAFVLVGLGMTVGAAVLDGMVDAGHRAGLDLELGWTTGLTGLALTAPGALVLRRTPRHPVAWILCLFGTQWTVDGLAASWLAYATADAAPLPGAALAFWIYQRLGAALLLSLPLVLLCYPDGRLPTGRWRPAALLSLAATALLPLVLLVVPSDVAQAASGEPLPQALTGVDLDLTTVPLPDAVWAPLLQVAYAATPVSLLVPFAVAVRRYRDASGPARRRMRWLVWAGTVDVLVMLATAVLPAEVTGPALTGAVGLTGLAVAAGIARPDVLDVDRLLSGTLLYGALAASVVVADVAVVGAFRLIAGDELGERDAALLAVLLVLAGYTPLRDRLWRLVRRVALGRRDDPYGVVSGLAEQLERSDGPEEQLLAVARSVAEAFRSSYVAVEVERSAGERLLVEHGTPPAETRALPITYRGEAIGRLVLPRGGPRTVLSARDERLLGDVVRQAAAACRASDLATQLQRSRRLLVRAREEERRRLRRDLHDGLGPSLGAVALRIDTARNLSAAAPEQADALLKQARDDVRAALDDVRRLVHDLRPPALDDVGLLGAVGQLADRLRGPELSVQVSGAGLDGLPAAVEVAAYRIAAEALTNVARHAAARCCRVRIHLDDEDLVVEVVDDGVGIAPGTPAGVGLVSLRERAAELGGECQIRPADSGGTIVRARLPLQLEVSRG